LKKISLDTWQTLRKDSRVVQSDRHGDKVLLCPDGTYIKLFRRKRLLSSAAWSPYAQRFADNATALRERGIPCPRVIDVVRIPDIERDAVHYHPLPGDTLREVIATDLGDDERAYLRDAFSRFVRRLHDLGVYFRSLHLGNVVLTPSGELGLIDISDIRIHRGPLSMFWRKRNLHRIDSFPDERDWLDRDTVLSPRPAPAHGNPR